MKKLLIFLVAASLAFSFTSCMEECEKDKTADVIITNNTGEDLWFDVTGDDNQTTENRFIQKGASSTYTIPAGNVKVWASHVNDNNEFFLIESKTLAQCETDNYSAPQLCTIFPNTTHITIKNQIGIDTEFDVWIYDENETSGGFYLGEVLIASGEQYTYANIPIGDGWANFEFLYEGDWYASTDDYEINACTPFEFTWNAKKSDEKVISKRRVEGVTITRQREIKK